MNEVEIKFVLDDDTSCNVADINEASRLIRLNMIRVQMTAIREGMTFDDCFSLCISHELIHLLIFDIEGNFASGQLDNICYNKYKVLKHWIGGIGDE